MGLDHDQKLITARVSPFAHAYYVWSTSVTAIVSYPAHGMTEWLNDRSHYSTTTSLGEVWMRLQIWTISDTCLVTSGWYGRLGVRSSTCRASFQDTSRGTCPRCYVSVRGPSTSSAWTTAERRRCVALTSTQCATLLSYTHHLQFCFLKTRNS